MVTFFTIETLDPSQRETLGRFAADPGRIDSDGYVHRISVDGRFDAFLAKAAALGISVFHDPVMAPPPLSVACQGAEVLKWDFLDRLRALQKAQDGDGALVIIADGGIDSQQVATDWPKMNFEPAVRGPRPGKSARPYHANMCAIDVHLGAPKAAIGDLAVSTGLTAVATDLFKGFLILLGLQHELQGYRAWIISISLQIELPEIDLSLPTHVRLTLNPLHPLWLALTCINSAGFDVVIAAGNDGSRDQPIAGLACHPLALTVGSMDINDQVERLSSRGANGMLKPDFVSYTNFEWSGANGNYDTGTSAATALAAGLIASARMALPRGDRKSLPPRALKNEMMARNWIRTNVNGGLKGHDGAYGWGAF